MINSAGRILAVAVVLCLSQATAATLKKASNGPVHRLMIQVNQNDPALMNLALNNATNVLEYYRSRGEQTDVDIVAFGPGLHMLRSDTSPVGDRIKGLKDVAFPEPSASPHAASQGTEWRQRKASPSPWCQKRRWSPLASSI